MEPQWNPMAEEQALDRIHRIGQTQPVTTIRYIMKDTWEEVCLATFMMIRLMSFSERSQTPREEKGFG